MRKARILNVRLLLALRESPVGLAIGPMLGPLLVGSLPSVVYHISAPAVSSLTVKNAALSPTMLGLAVRNWNRAGVIGLLRRPASKPIAFMVTSGWAEIIDGGTFMACTPLR